MVAAHPSRRSNLRLDQWLTVRSMTHRGFNDSRLCAVRWDAPLLWAAGVKESLSDPLHRWRNIQIYILISEGRRGRGEVGRNLDFKLLILCLVAGLIRTVTPGHFILYYEAMIHEACLTNQSQQQPVWTRSEIKTGVGLLRLSERWRTARSEVIWSKAADPWCQTHLNSWAT